MNEKFLGMTDEEIYRSYLKEESKLIKKYLVSSENEDKAAYDKEVIRLKEKYKGTMIERLEQLEQEQEEKELDMEITSEEEYKELSLEEIMQIEDAIEFTICYMEYLEQKCDFGEEIEALSSQEKTVYYVDTFNSEVHASGFEGYLTGCYYQNIDELEESLLELGAKSVHKIIQDLKKEFPNQSIPDDLDERTEMIEKNHLSFDNLDNRFYDYEDPLEELIMNYVKSKEK